MNNSEKVAQYLLKAGAVKISLDPLFTWVSGIKSPVYCDLRALISNVEAREEIVNAFVEMIPSEVEVIAGTATAGIPWAAWVAEKTKKPMIYVRGEAKDHGTKKRIEGMLKAGQKVALIEDLISTGKSSISAINALREEGGAIVDCVFAINTYEMAVAKKVYEEAGVKVSTVTNFSTILGQSGFEGDKMEILSDFKNDPAAWAGKHGL